jgi:CheY-like chemotaxis protein
MATVLVVDDDDVTRETLQEVLECEGFATIGVCNGAEALAVLERSSRPSLIVLDLVMPVMGGWELLDALSVDHRWVGIPRLVVSALEPGLNLGVTPSVQKPFKWGQLISAVREACGKS